MLSNTMIVNDLKDKHVCNDERNYIIAKGYTCDDVNDTYWLDRLWPCFIHLNDVSDVRPIVRNMELVC